MTKETFLRDAPCEIIRMLIRSTARKIRAGDPRLELQVLADQADDGAAADDLDVRELLEVLADLVQP